MRKSFPAPAVIFALCVGLCGCGAAATSPSKIEPVATAERDFQVAPDVTEHRAEARRAVREYVEAHLKAWDIDGIHSAPAEGGTFRVAVRIVRGQRREILKFEAIRFFPEDERAIPRWGVTLVSATSDGVLGDRQTAEALIAADAPKAAPAPASPGAAPAPSPSPGP